MLQLFKGCALTHFTPPPVQIQRSRWPFLWPLHAYLQREGVASTTYVLNRVLLFLAGLILVVLATHLLRDEERVLGVR